MGRRLFIYICPVLMLLASCTLDEPFGQEGGLDGAGTVSFEMDYRPLEAALGTKAAGDAIASVNDISVVVYRASDGKLFANWYYDADDFDSQSVMDSPGSMAYVDSESGSSSASPTAESSYRRTVLSRELPYGVYRIYAVANWGAALDDASVATEAALKSLKVSLSSAEKNGSWTASGIAAHNQMFGFFTSSADNVVYDKAPDVRIDKDNRSLHAWVRRTMSKVTVAFDGSGLHDRVQIYIRSVQVKDVPGSCLLGEDNVPSSASELFAGETLTYSSSSDYRTWPYVDNGGTPAFGSHDETADALYFFENMQGVDGDDIYNKCQFADADGDVVGNEELKDLKPYGTYVEVKGYYVNNTDTKASKGDIIYRFMLGKNITNDFNAERNIHYKLTLRFKNHANDADWHIEYSDDSPDMAVPNPLYISYLHGERLDIPVTVRGYSIESFTAKIVDNPWYYEGHSQISTKQTTNSSGTVTVYKNDHDYNGFLSLKQTAEFHEVTMTESDRKDDYVSTLSSYTENPSSGVLNEHSYTVPVYTRSLLLGHGYSGNNRYVDHERTAKVKFTAVVVGRDGSRKTVSETIDVIQVKRKVNPLGVWRPHDKADPFNVILMESEDESSGFSPAFSDGRWTAEVIQGTDWVQISKDGVSGWGTSKVTGKTGTEVNFWYRPAGTCASNVTRCGVIRILYHNNNCTHYVFVSQGSAPVPMTNSDIRWHMTNLHCKGQEESSPLAEGSMFRYLNQYAILAENNVRSGYGPYSALATYTQTSSKSLYVISPDGARESKQWPLARTSSGEAGFAMRIKLNEDSSNPRKFLNFMPSGKGEVATVAQWAKLEELPRYYGVMYGEDSFEPKITPDDAYGYLYDGDDKGMRGMVVWDRYAEAPGSGNGNHVFFPIGATGHGHRKMYDDWNNALKNIGVLRYATMTGPLNSRKLQPLLYDLYQHNGAVYWTKNWVNPTASDIDSQMSAQDINYTTYDFNTYKGWATWYDFYRNSSASYDAGKMISSDACLIRMVN